VQRFEVLPCSPDDMDAAFAYFDRKDLHKLGLVDATSFVIMRRHRIRVAFTFDTHFVTAGFRPAG
jgi:predicted nucleic acid-binding protein